MIAVATLAVLGLFGLAQASPVVPALRVVGGSDAALGEFPSAVSVQTYRAHLCGGTLLSEQWVLTAAACFENLENLELSVRYADVNLGNGEEYEDPSRSVNVAKVIIHPNYTRTGGSDWILIRNDIALLQLESKISFSDNVTAVKLPKDGAVVPQDVDSVAVGWGWTNSEGQYPAVEQKVQLDLFSQNYCDDTFAKFNYSNSQNLCAGNKANTKGLCTGDGGSPLYVGNVQYGILSWFLNPCGTVAPSVFTNVAFFVDWIQSETGLQW